MAGTEIATQKPPTSRVTREDLESYLTKQVVEAKAILADALMAADDPDKLREVLLNPGVEEVMANIDAAREGLRDIS